MAKNGGWPVVAVVGAALFGFWWLTRPPAFPDRLPPCGGLGDINGDGVINMDDVEAFKQVVGKLVDRNNPMMVRADLNGDGVINISDFTLLRAFILGQIKTFPACK